MSLNGFKIGDFQIGDDSPCFIVAEIGLNHNGCVEKAKELVRAAVKSGANCAKFQMRNLETLYKNRGNPNDPDLDLGTQYILDLLSKFSLSKTEMFELFDYCKTQNILPLCTPWDLKSLSNLEEYEMPAFKLASADLTNFELLEELTKRNKPLLVSTGMSSEFEIKQAIRFLEKRDAKFALLHCNSTYPTPYFDVNLNYLKRLKVLTKSPIGYSGHERGIEVPIAAVALGVKIIEKHVTLDKNAEGMDHKVSLLPEEFSKMVQSIRNVEMALGSDEERKLTQGERLSRASLSKSLVSKRKIRKGEVITRSLLEVKSPGQGIQPIYLDKLVGKTARREISENEFIFLDDVDHGFEGKRKFLFSRPWGIPVRFHDFKKLTFDIAPSFVEFHLSFKDLDLSPNRFFDKKYDFDFAVHCPELFQDEHLLNLCSLNKGYLNQSISELKRVISLTEGLKKYFPKTKKPLLILNVGGFSSDKPLNKSEKAKHYGSLAKSLEKVRTDSVEIIIQTMPPYPWHFGGQHFHNIFVDPHEIREFCSEHSYRICFDLSHSKLACNLNGWSLQEFIEIVNPYIAHLHISDAQGVSEEGLQLGDGEIDLDRLRQSMSKINPKVGFIPEVWMGHNNNGSGFWKALNKLEGCI